jgi:hypothetical protein
MLIPGNVFTRGMEIGSEVIWHGRLYVLHGVDPMNATGRRAYLREGASEEVISVPLDEVEVPPEAPDSGSTP